MSYESTSPKRKDIPFTVTWDKEEQLSLTHEKLKLGNVYHFCLKN